MFLFNYSVLYIVYVFNYYCYNWLLVGLLFNRMSSINNFKFTGQKCIGFGCIGSLVLYGK